MCIRNKSLPNINTKSNIYEFGLLSTTNMAVFVVLRHPVTYLVTAFNTPEVFAK